MSGMKSVSSRTRPSFLRSRARPHAQIGALHARVGEQRIVRALQGDTAGLEDVAAVAELERLDDSLLDEKDRQAPALADPLDGLEDLLDDPRAEPLRRLV